MVELNTPLKYHMNDLVYYLNMQSGGNLGKQVSLLGSIAAMAKGMLYDYTPERMRAKDQKENVIAHAKNVQEEIDEFVRMVDAVAKAYNPMMDTNPYLFNRARKVRKAVQICEVVCFHIITKHELIAGNILRSKLVDEFGGDRIKKQQPRGIDDLS